MDEQAVRQEMNRLHNVVQQLEEYQNNFESELFDILNTEILDDAEKVDAINALLKKKIELEA